MPSPISGQLSSRSGSPIHRLLRHLLIWLPIQERRKQLSREVNKAFDGTVSAGPFAGLRLTPDVSWNAKDRAAMILGLYEREVVAALASVPDHYRNFLDLGAADGYYAIGAVVSRKFERAIAYEMSTKGRAVIAQNAALNGIADRLEIRGTARPNFWNKIDEDWRKEAVVLLDIEGAEFDLCTPDFFEAFAQATIIIELHPVLVADGAKRVADLKEAASRWFSIRELTTGDRNPAKFPALDQYEDTDRWLICSESRKQRMTWLLLEPLS